MHACIISCYVYIVAIDQNIELIKVVVKSIMDDDAFKLPTPQASASLLTATKLFQWMNNEKNEEALKTFTNKLFECLQKCLSAGDKSTSKKIQREKMWSSFHSLRISNAFVKLWHDFLDAVDLEKQQLFFQHVSDKVFQQLP